jgi:hypothetical protein
VGWEGSHTVEGRGADIEWEFKHRMGETPTREGPMRVLEPEMGKEGVHTGRWPIEGYESSGGGGGCGLLWDIVTEPG